MRNNIAVRESLRKFKDNISQTSQPRRSVSSGYVSAVQEDAAGRVVTASVRTNGGGTVRAQVPFGQNVYTGMVVQIENYGSPSLASWAVSGSASLPPGTSGGIIYNQNGSNVLMFDNIWVTDDGYIRAGGTLDENDEPTGSRAQMDEFGFSAWDQYDRAMFRVFARDVEPYLTGDAYLGYLDGGRIEMSAQNLRFGIYNADEVVMQFDPLTGNRITQNLWVGDEAGPQVGIGKWTVDGEDVSIIVARNAGTGTVSDIGNEPVFMVTAAPSRTTLHLGDPDHSTNYVFYDSSANSGEGELTVDAILRAREIEIFGAGLIAEGGYIGAVAGGTSQAGIWLRPKYLEGIGNGGDRTFLLAAASVTLDKHPLLPALGALTWDGGEGYVGDVLHQHWRWDVRGPDGRAGMYYGDDPRVAFDPSGNVKMKGWVEAWDGEVYVGRQGYGVEVITPVGDIDSIERLVSFVNNNSDFGFLSGIWCAADQIHSDVAEIDVGRINASFGTFSEPWTAGYRSYVRLLSNSAPDREAWIRLQAAGDNGGTAQAIIDLYSLRGDDGDHSRIDLNAGTIRLYDLDTEPTATTGMSLNNGEISYPDGSGWNPWSYVSGDYFVARLGGDWSPPWAQELGTPWRWGDLATNYVEIDGNGSITFVGNARITPRLLTATKTGSFNADETEALSYRCNTSTGNSIATLPAAAAGNNGIRFTFRKVTADASTLTVSTVDSGNIVLSSQYDYCAVESSGSLWERVG